MQKQSFFAKDNLEYFGLKMTRQDIMLIPEKVQAIKDVTVSTNKERLISVIGGE